MTSRRSPDFDLDQAMAEPGFTPRRSDIPALLERVTRDDDAARLAERALSRLGAVAAQAAIQHASTAEPGARVRLMRFLGKLAGTPAAQPGSEALVSFLMGQLGAADERCRRAAATALGKVQGNAAADALADALARESAPSVQRALVESLGKVGGSQALALLEQLPLGSEVERTRSRARLIADRTQRRAEPSMLDATCPPPGPTPLVLRCRAGLERFLQDELAAEARPRLRYDEPSGTRILATLTGPLAQLFRARTMLWFAFPLPEIRITGPERLADAVIDALTSARARGLFAHYTQGLVRYRLTWASGGKRRALVFQIAEAVQARCPELVNDPTQSLWDVIVYEAPGVVRVELSPRLDDPRFAYRRADVPAASHPTIAAALARAGGVREHDVVWDPFVGSGLELCERALLGPYGLLIGSDLESDALDAARVNLAAAGVPDERRVLVLGDATQWTPPERPTLIVTNPPLGRRVQRTTGLASMLERFVEHAAQLLVPDGRLVWMSPFPDRTEAIARCCQLRPTLAENVDMGGFEARLQGFVKAP